MHIWCVQIYKNQFARGISTAGGKKKKTENASSWIFSFLNCCFDEAGHTTLLIYNCHKLVYAFYLF